jgi:hypothetical protein
MTQILIFFKQNLLIFIYFQSIDFFILTKYMQLSIFFCIISIVVMILIVGLISVDLVYLLFMLLFLLNLICLIILLTIEMLAFLFNILQNINIFK